MKRRDRAALRQPLEWMAERAVRGGVPTPEDRAEWDRCRAAVLGLVDEDTARLLLEEAMDRLRTDRETAQRIASPRPAKAAAQVDPVEADRREWRRVVAMRRGHLGSQVIAPMAGGVRDKDLPEVLENERRTYLRGLNPWR